MQGIRLEVDEVTYGAMPVAEVRENTLKGLGRPFLESAVRTARTVSPARTTDCLQLRIGKLAFAAPLRLLGKPLRYVFHRKLVTEFAAVLDEIREKLLTAARFLQGRLLGNVADEFLELRFRHLTSLPLVICGGAHS